MLFSENSASRSATDAEPCGYSFGPFTLDLRRAVLLRDGEPQSLRPKSFDVLRFLAEHPQQLLEREKIMRAAWPGVVVTDDSLTQCLTEIRRALGDDERTLIRTVPRRGYLFDRPVQPLFDRASGSTTTPAPARSSTRRLPSGWTLAALALLAMAVIGTWWRAGSHTVMEAPVAADWQPPPASVAVLAFTDMSPTGDQEYLADGLAEEILNILAQHSGLTVIARTSSFAFKGQNVDIGTIARRLNVAHVLEGSVRKSDGRIRITAQLVDGRSGAHLWSETFDRPLDDVFATQDEIAQTVAGVLQERLQREHWAPLAMGSPSVHSPDPEAWELYLRGRYLYGRRMAGDRVQAQRSFEQALRIDPEFAAAWVALAAIYNVRAGDTEMPDEERLARKDVLPLMRQALERALALEPGHPEALLRMARFDWREGETDRAVTRMEQAMRTGRNHALVQSILGGVALSLGDPATGAELQGRAVRLDPLSATHLNNYGHFLFAAGRFVEADAAFREAATLNPEKANTIVLQRVWIAIQASDFAAASELAQNLPGGVRADLAQAMLTFAEGDQAGSDAALARLRRSEEPETASLLAIAHAYRGEADAAFLALGEALEELAGLPDRANGRHALVELQHSPFLRPLHADPRWQAWLLQASVPWRQPGDERALARLRAYAAESGSG